ncbi:hypothetical protein FHT44_005175 [Mycolicibacterium sp. BK634]|uniref:hypothetical protein n=1 Tax=Mycolicibacterium sp. BK634 TaxID=2587099 RepID=UPI00160C0AAB|nr:hypothetical protein [Mycolicibacterium sp. BK634]MBB3752663.1 hypothetical protein [Mycolicibacterium sp. BK634]
MTMTRSAQAEPFHCGRCNTDKKAKAKAVRQKDDGTTDVICNGCYGNVMAGGDP